MNFLDELNSQYGSQVSSHLSSQFGLDPSQTEGILAKAAPFLLGGLRGQMEQGADESALRGVIESHADEGGLNDLGGYFSRAAEGGGGGAGGPDISGLLGGNQSHAAQALGNQLGISPDLMAKILPLLLPLILGAVLQKSRSGGGGGGGGMPQGGGGGGDGGLGSILGGVLGGGSGGGGGGGMGDVLGAVLGGAGGGGPAAGGRGPASQSSGCLSALLGGLLRRK
jgi:hypothetical protein